jgi:transcription antitermination factor NusG
MTPNSDFSEALAVGQTQALLPMGLRMPTESLEPHWYAAYTCANHEKGVMRQLERRSVESFLPLYESLHRWKDRRIRLQLPVFPGYIFVRLALRDRLKVLEIPSVVRLVGFGGHPTPLPIEEIETIRTCIARRQPLVPNRYVRRGQRVRMLSGPLEGLTGVVVRQKNRTRFVISLELLMRSVAVEIDRADFDPQTNLGT